MGHRPTRRSIERISSFYIDEISHSCADMDSRTGIKMPLKFMNFYELYYYYFNFSEL